MRWLEGVISFVGRQDNVDVREAAIVALAFDLFMVVVAIASIMLAVSESKDRNTRVTVISHCTAIAAVKLMPFVKIAQNTKGATGHEQG